jgi:hypothetical protein
VIIFTRSVTDYKLDLADKIDKGFFVDVYYR